MAKLKVGDRVRIAVRESSEQDRKINMFFGHMTGSTGVIDNYYSAKEIAVRVDLDSLQPIPKDVHREATNRLRKSLGDNIPEAQRKSLTKEELEFTPHYVLLLQETDLEKI